MYRRVQCSGALFHFNAPAPTDIYTLSLHDALPISPARWRAGPSGCAPPTPTSSPSCTTRSEEHTSELQSHSELVCRLLLEKKKTTSNASTQLTRRPRTQLTWPKFDIICLLPPPRSQ